MPVSRLKAPVMLPVVIVTVSAPVPVVTEPIAPAPVLKVRLLVPSPRLRLPVRAPVEPTVAVSLPEPRVMFSSFKKVTLPKVPPPLLVRPMVLLAVSLLATVMLSVPSPPSMVMVVEAAALIVVLSLPAN